MPPLLSSRPPALQVVIADALPALFGVVVGLLLISSKEGYLIGSIIGIGGGFFAGLEHRTPPEGAMRGLVGGTLFGLCILAVKEISGGDPKAELPDPAALLMVLTVGFGSLLGALGGWTRARHISRENPPPELG